MSYLTPSMARAYQESLLHEANKLGRPVKGPLPPRPRLTQRLLLWLGDQLIAIGTALRKRYEPAVRHCTETLPSAAGKARA
jgi:hypothetical protein